MLTLLLLVAARHNRRKDDIEIQIELCAKSTDFNIWHKAKLWPKIAFKQNENKFHERQEKFKNKLGYLSDRLKYKGFYEP